MCLQLIELGSYLIHKDLKDISFTQKFLEEITELCLFVDMKDDKVLAESIVMHNEEIQSFALILMIELISEGLPYEGMQKTAR